ncbi:MAG: hypothetical protein DRR19_28970 [Candidatus Parabeggiatoa sp. nov. 1]|nr:MAG: hypothetical protein DRR19_28970 [Gammaproteobacteria bacterium]HEC85795.1 hypothetical protein [Thioploca sp.]
MHCSFDRTGFPYLVLDKLKLAVSLLPITKIQFERYLADVTPQSDLWYDELLKLNPRISPTRVTLANREQLFLTGLLPDEAEAFAHWLGNGYRVPTVTEWRTVYQQLPKLPFNTIAATCLCKKNRPIQVKILLQRLHRQLYSPNTLEFSMMQGGFVEWAQEETNEWLGLGAPRSAFLNNLWNPMVDTVRPIRPDKRHFYFGLRLVKPV